MKTKEFIRRVEELGLEVGTWRDGEDIYVKSEYDEVYALVNETYVFSVDTSWSDFLVLEDSIKSKLFNLLVEYAGTPVEERKEEKKYLIKHKLLSSAWNYLNYDEEGEWLFAGMMELSNAKTHFTLSELPDWVHEMLEQGHLVKEEVE